MLEKVIENWTSRLDYIRASRGSHMPEIIFKILHAEIVEVEIEVVSPSIVPSGNFAELNSTVICMVLKANDRRTSCPCHDEFRGPRSDYVRQELTFYELIEIHKQDIEDLESVDLVQSDDRMTVGNLREGLSLIEKWLPTLCKILTPTKSVCFQQEKE
ncbi:hypothetical protein TNCV_4777601 [Trichonephila clavipes]|nr:hypothetical protein TNCV_4777601 [Trichonephila clavipes]